MFYTRPLIFSILLVCCTILMTSSATAQFETTLGTLSSNGQSFTCISQAGLKTKIRITNGSGKQKFLSKKKTKRNLKKLLKSLRKQNSKFRRLKKKRVKALNKLIGKTSLLPDPKKPEKIAKIKEQIAKLEVRISATQGDVNVAKSIASQIKNCDAVPDIGNGKNILIMENKVSPTYGSSYFILAAVHAYPIDTSKSGNQVCAVIDGEIKKASAKSSHCFNIQDKKPGEPAFGSFRACYNLPAGPNNSFVVLRHGLDYYHEEGRYEEILAMMNAALQKDVTVYLPKADGSCR